MINYSYLITVCNLTLWIMEQGPHVINVELEPTNSQFPLLEDGTEMGKSTTNYGVSLYQTVLSRPLVTWHSPKGHCFWHYLNNDPLPKSEYISTSNKDAKL